MFLWGLIFALFPLLFFGIVGRLYLAYSCRSVATPNAAVHVVIQCLHVFIRCLYVVVQCLQALYSAFPVQNPAIY